MNDELVTQFQENKELFVYFSTLNTEKYRFFSQLETLNAPCLAVRRNPCSKSCRSKRTIVPRLRSCPNTGARRYRRMIIKNLTLSEYQVTRGKSFKQDKRPKSVFRYLDAYPAKLMCRSESPHIHAFARYKSLTSTHIFEAQQGRSELTGQPDSGNNHFSSEAVETDTSRIYEW